MQYALLKRKWIIPFFTTILFSLAAGPVFGEDAKKMEGWEKDSKYNQLYHANELDRIKGSVLKVDEQVPMEGMAPATVIVLKSSDGDQTLVHVCPSAFISPGDTGLKKGDEVKIRGAWAEINGEDVFMASKIKKGDFFELKVRLTKDGKPFWTMTPEELEREKKNE
jgi:hypothetical protein